MVKLGQFSPFWNTELFHTTRTKGRQSCQVWNVSAGQLKSKQSLAQIEDSSQPHSGGWVGEDCGNEVGW